MVSFTSEISHVGACRGLGQHLLCWPLQSGIRHPRFCGWSLSPGHCASPASLSCHLRGDTAQTERPAASGKAAFPEHWLDHSPCLNPLHNTQAPRAPGRQVESLSSLVSWPSFLPNTLCLLCLCCSVSWLFPAALSKGETVNQCRMEGCHTKHPSPPGPAATRPSGQSLLRMSQGCPARDSKPTCLFPNTQLQMLLCRDYQSLSLPIDSSPPQKQSLQLYRGSQGQTASRTN